MEILKQLGDLFLAAVPTAIIVFLFYLFIRWAFFGPLEHVIEERSKRIQGARFEAEELRKNAQEKMRAYQEAKVRIGAEIEAARAELDSSTAQLAEQIARTILQPEAQMHPRPAGEV